MKRICAIILLAAAATPAFVPAAEPVRLRIGCIDAGDAPSFIAPLDVQRTETGWPPLNAHDFSLQEGGASALTGDRKESFKDTGLGLALIVALDASGSMKGRPMTAIQKGLAELVSRKRSKDRIAVLSFADDTRWETKWDATDKQTQDAFRDLQARGNLTRLYDAINTAITELENQGRNDSDFPVRRCILVMSDGHDEGSHLALSALLQHLANSKVRLDGVGLAHSPVWLGSLRQMTRTGYGEFLTAKSPEDLTNLMSQGIDSLLEMPAVVFQAKNIETDGKTHQLDVIYSPSGWHDQIAVELPVPLWRAKRTIWLASGVIAITLLALPLALVLKSRRIQPQPPQPPTQTATPTPPPPRAKPPAVRVATVSESSSGATSYRTSDAPAISYGDPLTQFQAPVTPQPAVRVPTALPPETTGTLQLKAVGGPYSGQTFSVSEQEYWIGSDSNNHLRLANDQGVSGNHVCIRRDHNFYRVYDNGSLNNTWVNGKPVSQQVTLLRPGDRLRVGATDFLIEVTR